MRAFEIILVIFTFLTLLQCFYLVGKEPSLVNLLLPVALVTGSLLHILIEKARWQMIPAYGVAGFVTLWIGAQIALYKPNTSPRWLGILREFTTAVVTLLCILILGAGTALSIAVPVFQIPPPSGSASIGTQDIHLIDTTRPELFTDDPNDYRELLIRVWYPAEPSAQAIVQPFWPELKRGGPLLLEQIGLPNFLLDYMALIPSHSYVNAPVSTSSSKYPVVVFSHGYTDDLSGELTLMEELASQGYIVFAISHPYEALITEFPDGRIILADPRAFPAPNEPQVRQLNLDVQFDTWVRDTDFVLDQLEGLNADKNPGPFSGRLDLQKVGLAGYSFGGATAVEVCVEDRRCQAGVNLDGSQFGYTDFGANHLKVPFMFFYSENNEGMNDYIYAGVENWAYRVTIDGAKHLNFSDKVLWSPYLQYAESYLPYGCGPIQAQRIVEIKRAYLTAFFDRHLKGKTTPILDSSSVSYTEVHFQFRTPP